MVLLQKEEKWWLKKKLIFTVVQKFQNIKLFKFNYPCFSKIKYTSNTVQIPTYQRDQIAQYRILDPCETSDIIQLNFDIHIVH